jgi:hypothetical protein
MILIKNSIQSFNCKEYLDISDNYISYNLIPILIQSLLPIFTVIVYIEKALKASPSGHSFNAII